MSANERYRKWFLKLKADPAKFKAFRLKRKLIHMKYRQSRKYREVLAKITERRHLNPFKFRARRRAYYLVVKSDPLAYQAMLAKQRASYIARRDKIKKDPEAYRQYLEDRQIYRRYRKIINEAKALEAA